MQAIVSSVYTRVLTRFYSLLVPNRVAIHQWMWVESIQVTIWVGGIHTQSVLEP